MVPEPTLQSRVNLLRYVDKEKVLLEYSLGSTRIVRSDREIDTLYGVEFPLK